MRFLIGFREPPLGGCQATWVEEAACARVQPHLCAALRHVLDVVVVTSFCPAFIIALTISIASDPALAVGAPLIRGAPAAWAEIVGAYTRLNTLAGYRMNIVVSRTGDGILERGVLESASPNMRHLRLQVLQNTTEGVDMGRAFRLRVSVPGYPSGWRCAETPQTRSLDDPRDIGGELTVMRAAETAIDGASMHAYILSSGTPPRLVKHTLYIGMRTGLPRRQVLLETFGGERTTYFDYYDYGAKIKITPPSCQ